MPARGWGCCSWRSAGSTPRPPHAPGGCSSPCSPCPIWPGRCWCAASTWRAITVGCSGGVYLSVGVLLAVATWSMGRLPPLVVALLVVLAGLGGPMLTGGLSSRCADLVPPEEVAQRRALGMDATIYGVAATAGPALVALINGWGVARMGVADAQRDCTGVRDRRTDPAEGPPRTRPPCRASPRCFPLSCSCPRCVGQLRNHGHGRGAGRTRRRRRPVRPAVRRVLEHRGGAAGRHGRREPARLARAQCFCLVWRAGPPDHAASRWSRSASGYAPWRRRSPALSSPSC